MHPLPLSGLLLVTCGLASLIFQSIRWTTPESTPVLNPATLSNATPTSLPRPLLIGFISFTSGFPLLLSARHKPI